MLNTAIIGAGPYGLSIAAHLRARQIPFRIFGRPMDSWLSHMPKGMLLKSDGFASNISDPNSAFTLKQFCMERGIPYADCGSPVSLETFSAYGLAFRARMVPELEEKLVDQVDNSDEGFSVRLENGETFTTQRIVLAVGITHFEYVPENLSHLPVQYLTHSASHREVEPFKGRNVVVIGGGASALDLAGLLHQAGAEVQLVSRQPSLVFHSRPTGKVRSLWQRLRSPSSGLGPGLRSRFFADAPWFFYYLPERLRLKAVERALGPSGGYFVKDMVVGKLPLLLGYSPEHAEVQRGKVHLRLGSLDGTTRDIVTEHVIAATGYKVDLARLKFLSSSLRSQVQTVNGAPVLSSAFESSVPGLYFSGVAAANNFGPVMRFAFGARFAASRLANALQKAQSHHAEAAAAARVTASAEYKVFPTSADTKL
jgi:cation diffusion facilitator CzcD-associated flavoprotein CzcO